MTTRATPSAAALTIAGLLSLAVAMGIGRFAFTPVLPLMLREGTLDVATGGWIAAANYAGYLVGAMVAGRMRIPPAQQGRAALAATALLTALMMLATPLAAGMLRFLAGVASAWAFVATAVWGLGALAAQGQAQRSGTVYAGVGVGIAITGLYCMGAGAAGASASALWLQLGVLAAVLALPVFVVLARLDGIASGAPAAARPARVGGSRGIVLCYGLMGFGYILPATFLPAMAREVVDDPLWFGLAWPIFGATAAVSTAFASRWMAGVGRLPVWWVSQAVMGVGALLPALWLNGWTIALSALCVGGTFMVITLAGVQEMRARHPEHATAAVARMTAAFAAGQIAGPIASAVLLRVPALRAQGLSIALVVAALALFASAAWLWRQCGPASSTKEISHAR